MEPESKLKSIAALTMVILGMAAFVILLIKLPAGSGGSSGSGWSVECHQIRVRAIAKDTHQPIEFAEAAWWPPASAGSSLSTDVVRTPPSPDRPRAVATTGPGGECVLSVTVWEKGGATASREKGTAAARLYGLLKIKAEGFELFSEEMALTLPIDANSAVEVKLKRIERAIEITPSEIKP